MGSVLSPFSSSSSLAAQGNALPALHSELYATRTKDYLRVPRVPSLSCFPEMVHTVPCRERFHFRISLLSPPLGNLKSSSLRELITSSSVPPDVPLVPKITVGIIWFYIGSQGIQPLPLPAIISWSAAHKHGIWRLISGGKGSLLAGLALELKRTKSQSELCHFLAVNLGKQIYFEPQFFLWLKWGRQQVQTMS